MSGVHALICDEGFSVEFESIGIPKYDTGKGSSSTRVMNDVLYNAADVAVALGIVKSAELCRGFIEASMSRCMIWSELCNTYTV